MQLIKQNIILVLFVMFFIVPANFAQVKTQNSTNFAIKETKKILNEILGKSFPELDAKEIKIRAFQSNDTFFKAQFSISRFLTFRRMQTTIFVNPIVYEGKAPEGGIRAILAHEMAHAIYYERKNRFQLLGLVSLINRDFTAKFERTADLVAIEKGYGSGLISYREWLYSVISEKQITIKKRNYFTPEELKIIIQGYEKNPEIMRSLKKRVPRNLEEVKAVFKEG